MSSRNVILNQLVQKVGFPFNEADLSPGLRRKIGELADLRQGIDQRQTIIAQRQIDIGHLKSRKENNTIWLILLIIAGAILLIFIVGIAALIGAYLMYRERQKIDLQIRQADDHIRTLNNEALSINTTLNQKLASVAVEVQGELSAYRIRVPAASQPLPETRPFQTIPATTFGRAPPESPTIQPDRNVQVVRETVREVVMIQCPYCRGLMPQTSLKCPHCGAIREV